MVLRKLKFLLKPPIPLLLGNGILFGVLLLAARASGWGTIALIFYAIYLYTARVRGRGGVGWTFLILLVVSYVAATGLWSASGAQFIALFAAVILMFFLGSTEYHIENFSMVLQLCSYAILGIGAVWWMERAADSGWIIVPIIAFFAVYVLSRDRIRFVEHEWNKESALWYLILAYISAGYVWGLSLLPLAAVQTTALFLVFFIIADEIITLARAEKINAKIALANAAWYIGSSAAIILIGHLI